MTLALLVPSLLLGSALVAQAQTAAASRAPSVPAPVRLICDDRVTPLGIDVVRPHLSWQSAATSRNWKQSAYQIVVSQTSAAIARGLGDVWDSGKQTSDESHAVVYGGPALESQRRYYWSVRVWDGQGQVSAYAPASWWEMGLLQPADWQAHWITASDPDAEADRAGIRWIYVAGQDAAKVPLETSATFRLNVTLTAPPRDATMFLTSRGDFIARVNGAIVNAKTRSWAAFDPEDITRELHVGANTIDVTVVTAMPADAPPPADRLVSAGLAGLVKVTHADGAIDRLPTNERWTSHIDREGSWAPSAVVAALDGRTFPDPGPVPGAAPLFRRAFSVTKPVRSARLYATALGSYRLYVNGTRVGADMMTPEFTDYRKRVVYQTYEVTDLLALGRNAVGAMLGAGWFGSPMSWYGNRFFFGPGPARLRAQLVIAYDDGTTETLGTNEEWKTAAGPVLQSEIYGGEVYDGRREQPGWSRATFDDSRWPSAVASAASSAIAVSAQANAPVRIVEPLRPKSVRAHAGGYIFDMGQNMVGHVTLRAAGPRGARVRLRFAEILAPDGGIYRENLRGADATDVYVLRGGAPETYTPIFTFHGFRYVEVTGFPGTPTLASLTGNVMSSLHDLPTGRLQTSSSLVNTFWKVGLWGQRGNFLSIPTDCPQRDERLGWTGDAGVFWRTGAYNYDIAAFANKWLIDLRDAQTPAGAFPNTAPHVPEMGDGAPGWGDAGVIVPWTTWMQYGNRGVIDQNWPAMEKWLAYIADGNPDFIRRARVGFNFSDWLAPDYRTSKELIATAYWALIVDQMVQMAVATGRTADADRYRALHGNIRAAYQKTFLKPDGTIDPGTQTAYLLTLNMRLAPEPLVPPVLANLEKAIADKEGHLSTGFLGTPFLLFTLADHNRLDLAYKLLLTESYPSWGYMIAKGATTWWERWNSDTGDPAMNSYNHYAFGSVVAWVYRYVAGIDTTPEGPGFKKIVIHPRPNPQMRQVRGEYDSIYGTIVSEWTSSANGPFTLRVKVPANTTATVYLPSSAGTRVTQDGRPVDVRTERDRYVVQVGSGDYRFEVR